MPHIHTRIPYPTYVQPSTPQYASYPSLQGAGGSVSHSQTLQVAKVQMVKGEREGWQVPLYPLSLEECGAADSASLLASLAAEKPSVSKSSSLATLSNLAITPERVAKVVYIV